jgi:enolase
MGVALIVSCSNDPSLAEAGDSFLADLAVGAGACQLMAGGLCGGEYLDKYNRIMEIYQESPSIPFAGVKFRVINQR